MTPDQPPSPPQPQPDEAAARRARNFITAAILVSVSLLGGIIVLIAYKKLTDVQAKSNRPPLLFRLEDDLEAVERSGETVHLRELRGKVLLVGHIYTDCPRGCAGLAEIMKGFQSEYGDDPNLHLVNFSVDPEGDPPEQLRAFTERQGITGDNWWFLTGEAEPIHKYLTGQFHFAPVREIPPDQRLSDADLWEHDLKLALVDHLGHIRGYYDVLGASTGDLFMEKLHRDLKYVLKEAREADRP